MRLDLGAVGLGLGLGLVVKQREADVARAVDLEERLDFAAPQGRSLPQLLGGLG